MAYLGEFTAVNSAADADKLDGKDSTYFEVANPNIQSHISSTSNPHSTTAAQVGADPSGTASTLMTNHLTALDPHTQYTTAEEAAAAAPVQSVAGKTGAVSLVKGDVGLSNVDNTSDLAKPISTAVSTALGLKADLVNGLIPANQLPSYVDDVLEFANLAAFPATGESGKIYLAIDTNKQYRWSGSTYVITGSDLALGETSSTAYRGDRGKIAYDHSQVAHAPSNAEANVNADWNATSGDAQILNKPVLGEMAFEEDVATDGKQYVRKDKAWSEVVIPEGGVVAEAKSTAFTAVKNRRYICDTSSAGFTCTLPASPAIGDYIEFEDAKSTWDINSVILDRNGQNITSLAENLILNIGGVKVCLTYVSATIGWNVASVGSVVTIAGHDHDGIYEPADATILKDVDIGATVQAYNANLTTWAGKTVPSGTVVGTSDAQTLTNKTLTGYTESIYNLTGTEISATNGNIQYKTLTGNTVFTEALSDGQSVTLMLNPATYSVTWPTTTWIGSVASTAPTLVASVYNCITFFQIAGTLYGKYEGRV